jgi:cellulose synthase/poly-beta-1,6-N-acetylglucosamine synthase-like glycosyltransferase/spore germination protein YaaH/peptidoglycan/xylan/chitin deacetylase (PgdA/CDA1 family)
MRESSVFHDPSGRRRRLGERIAIALGALFFVFATLFALSLAIVPVLSSGHLGDPMRRAFAPALPKVPERELRLRRFMLARAHRRLLASIRREEQARRARVAAIPPARRIVAAFYAPWQETGLHSLRAHADRMTHLLPAWLRLAPDGSRLDFTDWDPLRTPHNVDVLRVAREHRLVVMPVLSNAEGAVFDADRVHRLLADPARQDSLARATRDWLRAHGFRGLNVDFENLPPEDDRRLPGFLSRLQHAFAPAGLTVSFDLEPEDFDADPRALAAACDFIVLMAYDEHGATGAPGPLCSVEWYRRQLDRALARIPADRLVLGMASFSYDWPAGGRQADALTYQQALLTARDNRPDEPPADVIDFDAAALNPTFNYMDADAKEHEVWMLDATTAANQWALAAPRGLRGASIWVLGAEDPALWSVLDQVRAGGRLANTDSLEHPSFPYGVEFQGDGEILTVAAMPQAGVRRVDRDSTTGLVTDQEYERYPTSYVLRRTGYEEKALALTFDDGPSVPYTSDILDALERLHVPATFFVIGENAERHPDLVDRIWDEGYEIGNHTFTHPNLAAASPEQVKFELNATQRVLQADLGRSTLLFRAPYNADAEPTSAEEVIPILDAARYGYLTVGEYMDPQDWNLRQATPDGRVRERTADDIAAAVIAEAHAGKGNSILLHDGGGDRTHTVQALEKFVPQLQREGYHFVAISALVGATRDSVMPRVSAKDRVLLGSDRVSFEAIYLTEAFLHWAFIGGIALGALRVAWVVSLALLARRRERTLRFDPAYHPEVSVVIAAYNERAVIRRTIEAVLASRPPPLEVVVVDDGSGDGTAEEVEAVAAREPRVQLLRQANAGKAAALNRGIGRARGEVLVCLDADTLFAPETIGRLARHFADPAVGAVAGNVKVGNRVNAWTSWQALEYITSQNLDRRAYALLNAVTVVPGAVGAWRRSAVLEVGGYRSDTLAEDMDLTWRIRRAGAQLVNDGEALAFTEAPDSLGALYRQRYRWAFGTLQCLWKHRGALGRYGWFGRAALPSLWLFQILFQAISPLVDLEIAWTVLRVAESWLTRGLLTRDWQPLPQAVASLSMVAFLYLFFFALELIGSTIAFRLDREKPRLLAWLFWQRFVYRQLMYAVVVRALRTALLGMRASWGKLERKGTVTAGASR